MGVEAASASANQRTLAAAISPDIDASVQSTGGSSSSSASRATGGSTGGSIAAPQAPTSTDRFNSLSLFDRPQRAPRTRKAQFAFLFALALIAGSSCRPNPCGPGGEPWKDPYPVVAQTTDPDGTVVDWIRPESQVRPGETMATAPLSSPEPFCPPPPNYGPAVQRPLGPPGTVPIAHPRALTCQCTEGYFARPGSPCLKLTEHCATQGDEAAAKNSTYCCPGLELIRDLREVNGQCVEAGIDHGICARCGDGICSKGENACNCLFDCLKL